MIGSRLGRALPKIPVEFRRDGRLLIQNPELVDSRIHRITTGVDRVNLANGARPDPFAEVTNAVEGVALVAELGDDVLLTRGLHQAPDFVDRMGERLFAIDVLFPSGSPPSQRRHECDPGWPPPPRRFPSPSHQTSSGSRETVALQGIFSAYR